MVMWADSVPHSVLKITRCCRRILASNSDVFQTSRYDCVPAHYRANESIVCWLPAIFQPFFDAVQLSGLMTMLGTITQLSRPFFLHASTLAGAENEKQASLEPAEVIVSDLEAGEADARTVKDRQACLLPCWCQQ